MNPICDLVVRLAVFDVNMFFFLAGTIALSANLAEALDSLFNARIPKEWLKKSWEAATLGNWFLGLLQRFDQLNKWLLGGRPKAYWLTGFFNPQVIRVQGLRSTTHRQLS